MNRRVNWKKGMRLTDDIFRLSDLYHADLVKTACVLATEGRFGLMPSVHPFHVAMDIKKDSVEVTALNCLAITKDGSLLEASFDSRYSGVHDTRADFVIRDEQKSYWLLMSATNDWVNEGEDSCMPVFAFHVVEEFSHVPDDAIPIARIVYDMGWREDDISFVPPCLLLSAHPKYWEMACRFREMLSRLDVWVPQRLVTGSGDARRIFWPVIRELIITMDKESEFFSPATFLAKVQLCVSSFYCACTLDENLQLSDAEDFQQYALNAENVMAHYDKIREGLALVERICGKMENLQPQMAARTVRVDPPYIPDEELHQSAVSNTVFVKVAGLSSESVAYYSLDESSPSIPLSEGRIKLNPGFSKARVKEKDKTYHIQLKAVLNGQESSIVAFDVVVTKNVSVWSGPQI